MSERVAISIDEGVARVTMTRPDKRNALDADMFKALIEAGQSITDNGAVRAVVLHGEGKAFCAGLDFGSFLGDPAKMQWMLERGADSPANPAQRAAWVWQEVPVPVIAAVHGVALGGGCQIALAADLRYVTPDAQFSVMEIKWGLIPDMSITQTLPQLVRADIAKELTFTGRIVSGTEAAELGLATRVCDDPLAEAIETAKLIATKSPHAIRNGKKLFREMTELNRSQQLKLETALQVSLLGSPNQMEAVQANMQKRPPDFKDPE